MLWQQGEAAPQVLAISISAIGFHQRARANLSEFIFGRIKNNNGILGEVDRAIGVTDRT